MRRHRAIGAFLVSAVAVGALAFPVSGQSPAAPSMAAPGGSAAPGRIPNHLVLGLVPSSDANALVTNAQPLADYLTTALGIPTSAVVTTDYPGLVVAMGTGQADIGLLPPFSLIQAVDESGADIILQSVRNGSTTYHSQWFTNTPDTFCADAAVTKAGKTNEDPPRDVTLAFCNGTDTATTGPLAADTLAKIPAGAVAAFVSPTSASGYIFPAVQLLNAGIDPTTGVSPLFAGGHDKAIIAVCDGDAQVGVSFNDARVLPAAVDACGADMSKVVVFALSPEIPNDGVAVAGDLDASLKQKISDALIAYGKTEDGAKVLNLIYQISEFAPADIASLEIVREAAEKIVAP